ncbi:serine--tRNA ligase [Marinigracilibium pacificum]|uniref:Serine--tRNA ligase n=1 Tax=Marinigracilibium pacificum TaxID=2729599 RepID=A0A848IXN1_9BACT|nr:serine--tRNA ligase [Marinigracilibium pacificum]NMM47004.1 serine--tRNA ligase [Marinigracilibium pacificum]
MLEIQRVQQHKSAAIKNLQKRGLQNAEELLDNVIALDQKRKNTQTLLDSVLNESKTLAKDIGRLMKEGKKDEANSIKEKTSALKEESKKLADELKSAENELIQSLYNIPNIPHESVPAGNTDEDNVEIRSWGTIPELPEVNKPHWDLIKELDIIDFDLGVKITGAGFPVYKGKGSRLVRALVNFFLDEASDAGYMEVQPPLVINEASGYGTGQLPDKEGQMYHITEDDLYLIPTAEVPITNLYRDVIVKADDLPVKNVGYTPCFRREAGSWGAHVRGLNRLHQFDKVEIVQITKPEDSYNTLEIMCEYVEGLLKKLELPYRVLRLCGGDLGFTSALTYDMEVYSAAQKRWLEVSSVSNFETYQANRLKLRYKNEDNKTQLLHTLNGSALALPRILAAIIENNQDENGIKIPDVLQKYTGFDRI